MPDVIQKDIVVTTRRFECGGLEARRSPNDGYWSIWDAGSIQIAEISDDRVLLLKTQNFSVSLDMWDSLVALVAEVRKCL